MTCIGSACKNAFRLLASLSFIEIFRVARHQTHPLTLATLPVHHTSLSTGRHHSPVNAIGAARALRWAPLAALNLVVSSWCYYRYKVIKSTQLLYQCSFVAKFLL